jgi:hypothetical protein
VKPIPTPTNVVTHLRAMHERLDAGWSSTDDAWWTTQAAIIIERLVRQRDEAEAAQNTLKAERDEARRECCNTWEAVMFRPAADVAADKGWDCFAALEQTARESYKGGD